MLEPFDNLGSAVSGRKSGNGGWVADGNGLAGVIDVTPRADACRGVFIFQEVSSCLKRNRRQKSKR